MIVAGEGWGGRAGWKGRGVGTGEGVGGRGGREGEGVGRETQD